MTKRIHCSTYSPDDPSDHEHRPFQRLRVGYPKEAEWFEDPEENTLSSGSDYDRSIGKVDVYRLLPTVKHGEFCPYCKTTVCGQCGSGLDKDGVPNDDCCDSLKVSA